MNLLELNDILRHVPAVWMERIPYAGKVVKKEEGIKACFPKNY